MKDHEIIELYWARNESAITATAEKYGSYCHTIAYNILRNKEDAEECANDTYLGAWNSIPPHSFEPVPDFFGNCHFFTLTDRLFRRGRGERAPASGELGGYIVRIYKNKSAFRK